VITESTASLAVLYHLCKDGLKVWAGIGYNIWMKDCGVMLIVACKLSELVRDYGKARLTKIDLTEG
jgi:hypothetical protein